MELINLSHAPTVRVGGSCGANCGCEPDQKVHPLVTEGATMAEPVVQGPYVFEGLHFSELLKAFDVFDAGEDELQQYHALDYHLGLYRRDLNVQNAVRDYCLALAKEGVKMQDPLVNLWRGVAAVKDGIARVCAFMLLIELAMT